MMTTTRNIARLMTDGRGRRAQRIAESLGLTLEQASLGLEILRKHSRVRTREGVFHLTDKGHAYAEYDHAANHVKRVEAQKARREREKKSKSEINRDYRAKKAEEHGKPPPILRGLPEPAVSIVDRALAKRPALQMAWGQPVMEESA